jgi:methyltransferase (TIGR00027 family)
MVRAHLTDLGQLDDPFAVRFLGARQRRLVRVLRRVPMRGPSFGWLAARIKWFDELVRTADERQVVTLGAGYDARAWRFARDGVRFWEVDHPATQAEKQALAPPGGPTYVALDLLAGPVGPALADAGLDPGEPTLYVAEGVAMYLADDELRAVVTGLGAAPGSRLAFNIGVGFDGGRGVVRRLGRRVLARRQEPIRSTVTPDDVRALLADAGWQATTVTTGPELGPGLNPRSAVVVAHR